MALISGEAGIGKSTLVEELESTLPTPGGGGARATGRPHPPARREAHGLVADEVLELQEGS
jgi:predicted ATPase